MSFYEMAFLRAPLSFRERVRYLELAMLPHERRGRAAALKLIAAGFDPES